MNTNLELQLPNIPPATIRLRDIEHAECEWKITEKVNYFIITGTFRKGVLVLTSTTNIYKIDGKLVSRLQLDNNTQLMNRTANDICVKLTEKLQQYALVIRERIIQ